MKIYAVIISILLVLSIYYSNTLSQNLAQANEYAETAEQSAYEDCRIMMVNQRLMSEINGCVKGIKLLCQESYECVIKLSPICEEVVNF